MPTWSRRPCTSNQQTQRLGPSEEVFSRLLWTSKSGLRFAEIREVRKDSLLGAFPQHLGRLHDSAPLLSRQLGVVLAQDAKDTIQELQSRSLNLGRLSRIHLGQNQTCFQSSERKILKHVIQHAKNV